MKSTRINASHAQKLINNVKSVIRLGGFETGLRTNLNKAIEFYKGSFSMTYSSPEYLFEKEYQLEVKARFTNFSAMNIDKSRKEMIEMFFFYLRDILYKNEYSNKNDFCQQEGNTTKLWHTLCA